VSESFSRCGLEPGHGTGVAGCWPEASARPAACARHSVPIHRRYREVADLAVS
jgi:hypothetical protein